MNRVQFGVLSLMAVLLLVGAPATAGPIGTARPIGTLEQVDQITPQRWRMFVHSPAMGRDITLQVLRPADTSLPRPTLYLLNGAGAGVDGANWMRQTDVEEFFATRNVNVVIPVGGYSAYYTDWQHDDPVLGRNQWQTFLTHELPPVIDKALDTTGRNAIGGLSMSATSVLDLAIQAPGLYRGVAAYSGCAMTSDPLGQAMVRAVVEGGGHGDADNMWGPPWDPDWIAHDPYLNAEKLRGVALYVSNATGVPGPYERLDTPRPLHSPPLPEQIVVGGVIEAITNFCAQRLWERFAELGIPATFDFRPTGTHSWLYWQDALHASWPLLHGALRP